MGPAMEKTVMFIIRALGLKRLLFGESGKGGAGIFARSNKSGITEFVYRFDGTIGGNNFCYRVTKKENGAVFGFKSMLYRDLGEAETEADGELLDRLDKIYRDLRIAAWNGFSKYNRHIRDGTGFSLSIRFSDGKSLYANGTNAFPPRYGEFRAAIGELLDPLRDSLIGGPDDGKS